MHEPPLEPDGAPGEHNGDHGALKEGPPPLLEAPSASRERLVELEDRWRRAVADLENYRRRVGRELSATRRAERELVLSAWLSVLDNLERALSYARAGADGLLSGLEAVNEEAQAVMARFGYERIGEEGVAFDPARHEVVAVVPADEAHRPGVVVKVTRPGWASKDEVLRPASVVVAKAES
jgi:molecular chaperone GrpE